MARVKGEPTRYPGIVKITTSRFERGYGYRARADAREVGGGQPEKMFETIGEARDWQAGVESKVSDGTYIGKSRLTVRAAIDDWCAGQRGAANTQTARKHALAPIVAALGDRQVQSITKADVERTLAALAAGEIEGTPARSIRYSNVTRAKWSSCWADLVAQGTIPRNVVALVKPLDAPASPDEESSGDSALDPQRRLSDTEVAALLTAHDPTAAPPSDCRGAALRSHRSAARRRVFLELGLLGLRRGELAGLRWSAIHGLDTSSPTLSVKRTRVATSDGVVEQSRGKTRSAARTLPLPPATVAALRQHQDLQAADRVRAGRGWKGEDDLHVLTVDSGAPVAPRSLDDWWKRSLAAAKIAAPYRLHDLRHTATSRLFSASIPLIDVASWLGHADAEPSRSRSTATRIPPTLPTPLRP